MFVEDATPALLALGFAGALIAFGSALQTSPDEYVVSPAEIDALMAWVPDEEHVDKLLASGTNPGDMSLVLVLNLPEGVRVRATAGGGDGVAVRVADHQVRFDNLTADLVPDPLGFVDLTVSWEVGPGDWSVLGVVVCVPEMESGRLVKMPSPEGWIEASCRTEACTVLIVHRAQTSGQAERTAMHVGAGATVLVRSSAADVIVMDCAGGGG